MYQYALELQKIDGTVLGQVAVDVDWEPAYEWTWLAGLRRGQLAPDELGDGRSIEPVWSAKLGQPYIEGFRASMLANGRANGAGEVSAEFSTRYFAALGQQASAYFVKKGKIEEAERFRYLVRAFPAPPPSADSKPADRLKPEDRFSVEEVAPELPLQEGSLEEFVGRAMPQETVLSEDLPVFFPPRVLAEVSALSRQAGPKETGGILIGHLHRDPTQREVFAEITAQIPAQYTEADATKLGFRAETWADVDAALALRRQGEIKLGWWHSHPAREWCKGCPVEKQRVCKMARDFFSEHDQALHRTIFPRAYSAALVVNDVAFSDPTFSLFGWRMGMIESRGYYLLGPTDGPTKGESNAARAENGN